MQEIVKQRKKLCSMGSQVERIKTRMNKSKNRSRSMTKYRLGSRQRLKRKEEDVERNFIEGKK